MTTTALRPTGAALLAGLAVLTACSSPATTPGPLQSPTPVEEPSPLVVDWSTTTEPFDLGSGWTVDACEGDGPFVCLHHDDRRVGALERMGFPIADPPSESADPVGWLLEKADAFRASLEADRRAGCGPDYRFSFDPHQVVEFGGLEAVRYSFTGSAPDGTVLERGVAWIAVDGHVQSVLGANAYAPGGCIDDEGSTWTVEDLEDALPALDDVARMTATATPGRVHGMVYGRILESEGGRLVVDTVEFLSGEEAERAARDDGEHSGPDSLPNDVYVRDRARDEYVLPVGFEVAVTLVDCTEGCKEVDVELAAWLSGEVVAFNGSAALYRFTVAEGVLVHVAEQYLP